MVGVGGGGEPERVLEVEGRGVASPACFSSSSFSVSSLLIVLVASLSLEEAFNRFATEDLGLSVESLLARILDRMEPRKVRDDSLVSDLLKEG